MEITVNLKISAEGIFAEVLKAALKSAAAPDPVETVETVEQEAAAADTKTVKAAKVKIDTGTVVKPAKAAKTETPAIGLTDIRTYVQVSAERKALLKEILTGYNLEEPKLQFLPEDKFTEVMEKLKAAEEI